MKSSANLKTRRLLAALGGAAAVLASFASLDVAAQTSINTTRHNLGTSNTTSSSSFSGTGEVCVFCHTPHGSNTTMAAPLWNKTSPTTTYAMYSTGQSASLDGTEAAVTKANADGKIQSLAHANSAESFSSSLRAT